MARMTVWRYIVLLLTMVCCYAGLVAQDNQHGGRMLLPKIFSESDSTVVCFEHNKLVYPGSRQPFDSLFSHLRSIASGVESQPLRILHIGGSHVQAGIFSGRMRTNMRAFSSNGVVGRGMTFPYSVMGTNGPKDYTYTATGKWEKSRNVESSPSSRLGLSGASITTMDISSTLVFQSSRPFESVLLFGENLADTAWVYPVLVAEGDTLFPPRSLAETGYEYLFSHPVNECTLMLVGDSCGGFAFRGMVADPYEEEIIYTASGINGAAVYSWLRCQEFEAELNPMAPDLVLFGIGINDANVQDFSPEQFKSNYRQLITRIRNCNPGCALLFITNNDCYLRVGRKKKTYNKNTEKVEQAFMELAEEYNGAVWNLYQIMGGYGSSAKWVKAGLMQSDHVHFTVRGYELLGDMLFNAILQDYQ